MRAVRTLPFILLVAACHDEDRARKPIPEEHVQIREEAREQKTEEKQAQLKSSEGKPTRMRMHNVDFRVDQDIVLHVRDLEGRLVPTKKDRPPVFEDKGSFIIEIEGGETAISAEHMGRLLNRYVFGDKDAPLKDLKLSAEGHHLRQRGKAIRGGVPVTFEVLCTPSVTKDGMIKLTPIDVVVAGLPVKEMMGNLGIKVDDAFNVARERGVWAEGDALIADVTKIVPPPRLRGKIRQVRVDGEMVVSSYGPVEPMGPKNRAQNYMFYKGGELGFGKLTMHDADILIADNDPKDPFDFFMDHYARQLVAGYSRTTGSGGLQVFMPDFGDLGKR